MRAVLADGSEHALDAPTVIGREPDRGGFVPLVLPAGSVMASKNHVLVEPFAAPDVDVVAVTDLATTNGTTVDVGNGEIGLRADETIHVTTPCVLSCGEALVRIER